MAEAVESDEINFAIEPAAKIDQLFEIGFAVVDPIEHDILKGDHTVRCFGIIFQGLAQNGERELSIDRHEFAAQSIVGGVERDRQPHLRFFFREFLDLVGQAAGGDRDPPLAEIRPLVGGEDRHASHDVVVIEERFAHPHVDEIRNVGVFVGDQVGLADDLGRGQVPVKAQLAGRAKEAVERTADLR